MHPLLLGSPIGRAIVVIQFGDLDELGRCRAARKYPLPGGPSRSRGVRRRTPERSPSSSTSGASRTPCLDLRTSGTTPPYARARPAVVDGRHDAQRLVPPPSRQLLEGGRRRVGQRVGVVDEAEHRPALGEQRGNRRHSPGEPGGVVVRPPAPTSQATARARDDVERRSGRGPPASGTDAPQGPDRRAASYARCAGVRRPARAPRTGPGRPEPASASPTANGSSHGCDRVGQVPDGDVRRHRCEERGASRSIATGRPRRRPRVPGARPRRRPTPAPRPGPPWIPG